MHCEVGCLGCNSLYMHHPLSIGAVQYAMIYCSACYCPIVAVQRPLSPQDVIVQIELILFEGVRALRQGSNVGLADRIVYPKAH